MVTLALLAAMVLDQLVELTVPIKAGAIEEPCFHLDRDWRLEVEFTASAPLDFNIHYHEDGVHFPADLRAVSEWEGRYVAPAPRTYCLMWTNKQAMSVELDYRYRIYRTGETQ